MNFYLLNPFYKSVRNLILAYFQTNQPCYQKGLKFAVSFFQIFIISKVLCPQLVMSMKIDLFVTHVK